MNIDLTQFDTEAANLDLVIRTTCALHDTVGHVPAEISRAVHTVTNALPVPRLGACKAVTRMEDSVGPRVAVLAEPIVHELLGGCRRIEVPLGEASRANVDLADLTNSARNATVVTIDHEKLDIDHTLTSGHDILLGGKEGRVLRHGRDGEV